MLVADDRAVREIEDALRIAERSGDDLALAFGRLTLGFALVHRQTDAERDRGQKLLAEVSEAFVREGHNLRDLPIVNVYLARVYLARDRARRGDCDDAIPLMRAAVDHLFREGRLLAWGVSTTGVLVETLLDRGAESEVAEAEAATERLAAAPADEGLVMREIWLLRLRALLVRAHGDDTAYGTVTLIEKCSGAVGFEAVATEHRWVVHISGGNVGRGDLTPDREAVCHLGSPFGRAEQMPSRPEVCGDAAEGGQEPLRMPRRFEAFHRPFALSGGLMRVLGAVVQIPRPPVLHRRHELAVGDLVAAQLVGDQHARHVPQALEQLTEESLGRHRVSA